MKDKAVAAQAPLWVTGSRYGQYQRKRYSNVDEEWAFDFVNQLCTVKMERERRIRRRALLSTSTRDSSASTSGRGKYTCRCPETRHGQRSTKRTRARQSGVDSRRRRRWRHHSPKLEQPITAGSSSRRLVLRRRHCIIFLAVLFTLYTVAIPFEDNHTLDGIRLLGSTKSSIMENNSNSLCRIRCRAQLTKGDDIQSAAWYDSFVPNWDR